MLYKIKEMLKNVILKKVKKSKNQKCKYFENVKKIFFLQILYNIRVYG